MHTQAATSLLHATGLTATLTGDAGPVRVLDGVEFAIRAGEIVDVVGPSGSGKSTLLRALAWLLPGAGGALELDGRPHDSMSPQEWRAQVALVPQKPAIIDATVERNLLVPWTLKARSAHTAPPAQRLCEALDSVGLSDVALDRSALRLSVGQQARIAFVRVLLTAPRVLLLDEAEAALDDTSAQFLSQACSHFASEGGGIVRVRHRTTDGLAARRLTMQHGRLEEVAP